MYASKTQREEDFKYSLSDVAIVVDSKNFPAFKIHWLLLTSLIQFMGQIFSFQISAKSINVPGVVGKGFPVLVPFTTGKFGNLGFTNFR